IEVQRQEGALTYRQRRLRNRNMGNTLNREHGYTPPACQAHGLIFLAHTVTNVPGRRPDLLPMLPVRTLTPLSPCGRGAGGEGAVRRPGNPECLQQPAGLPRWR